MKTIRRLIAFMVISFVIILLIEIMVRFSSGFISYPQKSLFVLSKRLIDSNLRTYPEFGELVSVRILLPEKKKKEILVLGDSNNSAVLKIDVDVDLPFEVSKKI